MMVLSFLTVCRLRLRNGSRNQEGRGGSQAANEQSLQTASKGRSASEPAFDRAKNQQGRQPLQGQMTLENALQVLDALKEGEKEMQDLRRPTKPGGAEPKRPLKDW